MAKILMKGNEAIAEAAIRAGCEAYYGYPITPQTEVLEYMSRRMPAIGRVFLQAESEVAAINMVYGAAAAGVRVMTTTSSPGFSLMQEGISYIACSEVPAVLVNVMRGGPGLGNIQPAQGEYLQMTKGGGHGDYHPIVLAPSTIQEMVDCVMMAFDLAEKYRTVTMVIADGMIGQMMEPVELPPMRELERKDWDFALRGCQGREKRIITSLYLGAENLERVNDRLQARLKEIVAHEQRWETTAGDDAEVLVVAFGTAARIAKTAIRQAREQGIKAGLFRPITVFPYPYDALAEAAGVQQQTLRVSRRTVGSHTLRVSVRDGGKRRSRAGKKLLVFELNAGQMLEDVRLATRDSVPIAFYGRTGGVVPLPEDVLAEIIKLSG